MNYIEQFKNYLLIDKKYSSNTILSYENDLHNFLNYIKKDLKKINKGDILNFLEDYTNKMNTRSVAHALTVLRSFYNYL